MRTEHEDRLQRRAREWLDESADHLDAATLSRLNRARHRALEAVRTRHAWSWWGVPAGALAMLVLLAVIGLPGPPAVEPPAPLLDDLELLKSADSLEMLEELEFYMWLEEAEVDAG